MKRRILSLLVATVMLISLMPIMTFATTFSTTGDSANNLQNDTGFGWDVAVPGQATKPVQNTNFSAKINNTVSHSGIGSMHLINYDIDSVNGEYWVVRAHSGTAATLCSLNGTYKMSFWAKGDINVKKTNNANQNAIWFYNGNNQNHDLDTFAAGETEDGFTYYEKEITLSSKQWGFAISDGNLDIYIDDISLQQKNSDGTYGENVMLASDFLKKMAWFDDGTPKFAPSTDGDSANNLQNDTVYGWDVGVPGQTTKPVQNTNFSAKINSTVTHRGSGSMHLINYDITSATDEYWFVRPHTSKAPEVASLNGTYKLSFWAKVNVNDPQTNAATKDVFQAIDSNGSYNLSTFTTGETEDGFTYYEKEITLNNARWGFAIKDGNLDIYIDDISIQLKSGDTYGENLMLQNDFLKKLAYLDNDTVEEEPEPSFAPSTDGDSAKNLQDDTVYGWDVAAPGGQATKPVQNTNFSAKINGTVTHRGSGSMHLINYDIASANDEYWVVRPHTSKAAELCGLDGTYKLSFWAKVNVNDKQTNSAADDAFRLIDGNNANHNLNDCNPGKTEDGFTYYEKELTLSANMRWGFVIKDGNLDIYIDDISLQQKNGDGSYGQNLMLATDFLKKMAYLDNDTVEEEVPMPVEPDDNVPDITEATNPSFNKFKWECSAWNLTTAKDANEGANPGHSELITSEVSHSGKSSLHIKYQQGSAVGELRDIMVRPMQTAGQFDATETDPTRFQLKSGVNYTLTMYIKVVKNNDNGLYVAGPSGTGRKPSETDYFTDMGDGWYKFEETATAPADKRITIGCNSGAVELYVDDVVCIRNSDSTNILDYNTTDVDIINNTSSFEMSGDGVGAYKVYEPRMFDEDGIEATELSDSLVGKTMTVATVLSNYSETGEFTGQLIVGLYKDDALKDVVLSDIATATTTGKSVKIFTDIELPNDLTGYTMKAFVWDSYYGMDPLTSSKNF